MTIPGEEATGRKRSECMSGTRGQTGSRRTVSQVRAVWVSLAALVIGAAGWLLLDRGPWVFYLFAHLGALGIMGLFGAATGELARRKQRAWWPAFLLGSLLPAAMGIGAVLLLWLGKDGHLYCGGSVCLAVAILNVGIFSLVRTAQPVAGGA